MAKHKVTISRQVTEYIVINFREDEEICGSVEALKVAQDRICDYDYHRANAYQDEDGAGLWEYANDPKYSYLIEEIDNG